MPLQDVALIGDSNLGLEREKKNRLRCIQFFCGWWFPQV